MPRETNEKIKRKITKVIDKVASYWRKSVVCNRDMDNKIYSSLVHNTHYCAYPSFCPLCAAFSLGNLYEKW